MRRNNIIGEPIQTKPDMQTFCSYATHKLHRTIQIHDNSPRKYDRDGSIDRSAIRVAALDLLDGHDYTLSHGRRDEHERPFLYPGHPRLAVGHRLRVLCRLSRHKHGVLRWRWLSRRKGARLGWFCVGRGRVGRPLATGLCVAGRDQNA